MLIYDVLVSRFTALCHLLFFPSECFFFSACPLVAAPLKGMSHFLLQPSITNVGQDLLGTSSYHARMQNLDMAWPLQCWTHSNYFLITVPWYADLKQMRDPQCGLLFTYENTYLSVFHLYLPPFFLPSSFLVSVSSWILMKRNEWLTLKISVLILFGGLLWLCATAWCPESSVLSMLTKGLLKEIELNC